MAAPMTASRRENPVRICVLSDEEREDFDPGPYLAGFDWEMHTLAAPVRDKVAALARRGRYDVFFNLCEGYEPEEVAQGGRAYAAVEVVTALEQCGVPFTGADMRCFDPTREEMQAVAEAHAIRFPRGQRVRSVPEAMATAAGLRLPIMVKHPQSYGSTGMYRESRADSLAEVAVQVERICGLYGAARMEEFIEGPEYNVLIVDNAVALQEPLTYPPAELVFPPGEEFWHTDVKWNYEIPFAFREVTEPVLTARLQEVGRRMFLAMGLAGYGRCDIRMDAAGELYVLEINPNPGIMIPLAEYGPADYMILYDSGGYRRFLERVLAAAFARHRVRQSVPAGSGVVSEQGLLDDA